MSGTQYAGTRHLPATLLTLLPTAGALIGAPAKELWVLSKLVPVAGLMSMALSLGGNIVPHQVGDYASLGDFSYSGMRNNNPADALLKRRVSSRAWGEDAHSEPDVRQVAEHFAEQVHARARDVKASAKRLKVVLGIVLLCIWILLICVACSLLAQGSIIVWWCTANNWIFMGYGVTVLTSVFENYASAPFVRSWTMRISRAPKLCISADAPWASILAGSQENGLHCDQSIAPVTAHYKVFRHRKPEGGSQYYGRILLDKRTLLSKSKDDFYVIISQEGTTHTTTALPLLATTMSVAAFTMSTALFTSFTPVTINLPSSS